MTGVPAALTLAVLMLSMTVISSMIVAALVAGGQRLPLGFANHDRPRTDALSRSGVAVFGLLALLPQLAAVAAGLAPNSMFTSVGSLVLLIEPVAALAWLWYLTVRYRRPPSN